MCLTKVTEVIEATEAREEVAAETVVPLPLLLLLAVSVEAGRRRRLPQVSDGGDRGD